MPKGPMQGGGRTMAEFCPHSVAVDGGFEVSTRMVVSCESAVGSALVIAPYALESLLQSDRTSLGIDWDSHQDNAARLV
jgi:hypothetical protein